MVNRNASPQPTTAPRQEGAAALPSAHVDDAVTPFPVTRWSTPSVPLPRFGDLRWRVEGLDPLPGGRETLDFTTMTPEWALYARELLYWRTAGRDALRDVLPPGPLRRVRTQPRSSTLRGIHRAVRLLERASSELGLGLPPDWDQRDTEALRDWVRANEPTPQMSSIVHALHTLRSHLTLGGIAHDPLDGASVFRWAGAPSPSDGLRGTSVDPHLFVALVGAALTYVETYADDIVTAKAWRDQVEDAWARGAFPTRPKRLPPDHPGAQQGFRGPVIWEIAEYIREHGAVPAYTTSQGGAGRRGDPAFMTLAAVLNNPVLRSSATAKDYVRQRIAEGVPLRLGMLPLPVTDVLLPDGSTGPWRDSWCWTSITDEVAALRDACVIVIAAFTGMRAGEAGLIPKRGWRTTWYGHDAITAPLIKTAEGEDQKWWATQPVIRACEILELTSPPEADYLLGSPASRTPVIEDDETKTAVATCLRRFIAHVNTEESLHGIARIPAGFTWGRTTQDGATVTPHQMRFTLASIGNTADLGDVALYTQFHHAKHAMTWGYMANGGRDKWVDVLTETRAVDGLSYVVDLMAGIWADLDEPTGPAGRRLATSARAILTEAGVAPYDPDSTETLTQQFIAAVHDQPTILAFARSVASDLHLGVINHCYDDPAKRMCGGDEPLLAACLPERCGNALLSTQQVDLFLDVADEARALLEHPRLPAQQRRILERRIADIRRTVGETEGDD